MTTPQAVTYHADRAAYPARPAVNVKLCVAGIDLWPKTPRWAEMFGDDGPFSDCVERAYDVVQVRFWDAAMDQAEALGLGPIEQEGRSGGWLVLTDGRDPRDMAPSPTGLVDDPENDDLLHCDYCETIETAADLTPDWNGETGCHDSCEERRDWLTAYAALRDWCETELAAIPERVRNLAQQYAMDEAGADAARRMFAIHDRGTTFGVPA